MSTKEPTGTGGVPSGEARTLSLVRAPRAAPASSQLWGLSRPLKSRPGDKGHICHTPGRVCCANGMVPAESS